MYDWSAFLSIVTVLFSISLLLSNSILNYFIIGISLANSYKALFASVFPILVALFSGRRCLSRFSHTLVRALVSSFLQVNSGEERGRCSSENTRNKQHSSIAFPVLPYQIVTNLVASDNTLLSPSSLD